MPRHELILNEQHYQRLLVDEIPAAQQWVWLATSDLKDLHVAGGSKKARYRPFLQVLAELIQRGVGVRLLHAKEPGPRFRADFDRFPELVQSDLFERGLCPRLHSKVILIDGRLAYLGSANLTGAGLGAKGQHRRNFEAGIFTDDPAIVGPLMAHLDELWLGHPCGKCQRRALCPQPLDGV